MTTAAPLAPTAQALDRYHQLAPAKGRIYAVRWVRRDGRVVLHRYYRRRPDADAHVTRLAGKGVSAVVFVSQTRWKRADA